MPTKADLRERLYKFQRQFHPFVKDLLTDMLTELVHLIKIRMTEHAFALSIINSVKLDRVIVNADEGKLTYHIEYKHISRRKNPEGVTEEFDSGEAHEKGTKTHLILPRWKPLLKWQDKDTGQWRSSKGHVVSGQKRLLTVETTSKQLEESMSETVNVATKEFLRRTILNLPMPTKWFEVSY